jgi:hypothetical protein
MPQVFPLASDAGWKSLWPILMAVPLLLMFVYFAVAPRLVRFEVTSDSIRIAGDPVYGRTIPLAELRTKMAKTVDLSSEYRFTARTNGVGLPHYKGGWFRLASGEKALAFVGTEKRAVAVPHQDGYVVILGASAPEDLLAALRR